MRELQQGFAQAARVAEEIQRKADEQAPGTIAVKDEATSPIRSALPFFLGAFNSGSMVHVSMERHEKRSES